LRACVWMKTTFGHVGGACFKTKSQRVRAITISTTTSTRIAHAIVIAFSISLLPSLGAQPREYKSRHLLWIFVPKHRVELSIGHVCVRDIGDMASGTLGRRPFRGGFLVWQWMMPIGKETPAVRVCEALAVFYGHVDAVVRTIEIPASGGFLTGPVWKSRVKNPDQFFYDDRSFRKIACLQIYIDVFLFDIYVMIFGEVRLGTASGLVAVELSIIEGLGS
jgi:hypothetical protein